MWHRVRWVFKYTRAGKLNEYTTDRLLRYRDSLVRAIRYERGTTELFVLAKELAKVEHILIKRGEL